MIAELTNTAAVAKADLGESIARLSKTERQVGSDLSELRVLNNDATSGDSAIRRTVTEIESELRQARGGRQASEQLLGLLRAAENDRGRLLATPNRLLDSQPSLRRLKDGLSDAQLHTAALMGHMSAEHPLVQAAKQAEEEIGRRLHDELAIAVRGVESDVRLSGDRIAALESQLTDATARLSRLAAVRAAYAAQVAQTNSRTRLLERAEQSLADARAAHASAKAASLLSCVDVPDAGVRPVSPSRALLVLAGIAGGLLLGFGVVFLTVQPVPAGEELAEPVPSRNTGKASATQANFSPGRNLSLERSSAKGRLRREGVTASLQVASRRSREVPLSLRERVGVRGTRWRFRRSVVGPGANSPHPNPLPEGEGTNIVNPALSRRERGTLNRQPHGTLCRPFTPSPLSSRSSGSRSSSSADRWPAAAWATCSSRRASAMSSPTSPWDQ